MGNSELRPNTGEQIQSEPKLVDKIINKVKAVSSTIANYFVGMSEHELEKATGDFLTDEATHLADQSGSNFTEDQAAIDSVEAVLVFGAEEQAQSTIPPTDNPIAKLDENGKRRDAIIVAAEELQRDGGTLPSGENVIDEVVEVLSAENAVTSSEITNVEQAQEMIMSVEEAVEHLEKERFVQECPRFAEQILDKSRTNKVTYIASDRSTYSFSSDDVYREKREILSEHEALVGLNDFFVKAIGSFESHGDRDLADRARDMCENLSFIGEKEYKEAIIGIAEYWKKQLRENPHLKIVTVAGEIAKGKYSEDGEPQQKSDEYMLENILEEFSEEDKELVNRVVTTLDALDDDEVKDAKIVILDDWTISGSQLAGPTGVCTQFIENYPQLKDQIEVQLIVSNGDRLENGLEIQITSDAVDPPTVPVRAYFVAHHARRTDDKRKRNNTHTTGFHSSVDYDFEQTIEHMVQTLNGYFEQDADPSEHIMMPSLTNIVRPYRKAEGFDLDKERLGMLRTRDNDKLRRRGQNVLEYR
jgi:hypothetical protein